MFKSSNMEKNVVKVMQQLWDRLFSEETNRRAEPPMYMDFYLDAAENLV